MVRREEKTNRMSRVLVHNETVYLAGVTSDDKTLDIKGQTLRVLEIAQKRLESVGSSKEMILRTDIYVKNISRDFDDMNSIWDEWVSSENPPTRACTEANMARENILVEMVFVAHL